MAATRTFNLTLLVSALVSSIGVAPVAAAHRARLSADLADHLAAGSQTIDVIVHGTRTDVDSLARRYNLQVKKYLSGGGVLRVTAGQLAALADDDSQDHLSTDIPIHSTGDVTAETIAADQVWAGSEAVKALSGAGVTVAVIDSGVDLRHAALRNRVLFSKDFTGGDGIDRFGHGTHVAATIAGRPGASADTRDFRGVAYGANIVNLRVLDATGAGVASDVIEAIDWAVANRRAFNIRIINLSLGAPVLQPYRDDPLCEAVERAVAAGIVVVTAAGNYGWSKDGRTVLGSITSPGNDPSVITVGALDTHGTALRADDTVAKFSSKGPTFYDLVLKPDLVAPGTHVVSAEAAGSYLATTYGSLHVAGSGTNAYMQMSGTSMAAAVVSGTAALLLQERPKLTPRETKLALQLTSSFMPAEGLVRAGTGSLNALAATMLVDRVRLAGQSSVGLLSPRMQQRSEGQGLLRLLKYGMVRNSGAEPDTIVWGSGGLDTIVWGSGLDTIVWGSATGADTIVWGSGPGSDTIVWGSGSGSDTIVWGSGTGSDTIVWGSVTGTDTIVWGSAGPDTIVWGSGSVITAFDALTDY